MRYASILTVFASIVLGSDVYCQGDLPNVESLLKAAHLVDLMPISDGAMLAARQQVGTAMSPNEVVRKIFILHLKKESERLYEGWWENTDRNARILIIGLFLCRNSDDVSHTERELLTYARRFSSPEREERITEIEYIAKNKKQTGILISDYLKLCDPKSDWELYLWDRHRNKP